MDFSADQSADVVVEAFSRTEDPRLRSVLTSLTRHLHGFIKEVQLTEEEWFEAIKFLTATGHKCDDIRQEFILLSDTLGVSMVVDLISHRKPAGATESTVFGPFHRPGAPELPQWPSAPELEGARGPRSQTPGVDNQAGSRDPTS